MRVIAVFVVLSQRAADSSHPELNEEMYRAVRSVLLCVSEFMDSSQTPSDTRNDGSQLRLIQQEVTTHFSLMAQTAF